MKDASGMGTTLRGEREQALRLLMRWHRRTLALLEFPQDECTRELLTWIAEDIEMLATELTPPVTLSPRAAGVAQ